MVVLLMVSIPSPWPKDNCGEAFLRVALVRLGKSHHLHHTLTHVPWKWNMAPKRNIDFCPSRTGGYIQIIPNPCDVSLPPKSIIVSHFQLAEKAPVQLRLTPLF